MIVTGPNHALHAVLTLLTFWACGGWAWIWLIVAIDNRKRVRMIDTHGNVTAVADPSWTPEEVAKAQARAKMTLIVIGTIVAFFFVVWLIATVASAF